MDGPSGRNELLVSGRRSDCRLVRQASLPVAERPVFSALTVKFDYVSNAARDRMVTSDYRRHALLALAAVVLRPLSVLSVAAPGCSAGARGADSLLIW